MLFDAQAAGFIFLTMLKGNRFEGEPLEIQAKRNQPFKKIKQAISPTSKEDFIYSDRPGKAGVYINTQQVSVLYYWLYFTQPEQNMYSYHVNATQYYCCTYKATVCYNAQSAEVDFPRKRCFMKFTTAAVLENHYKSTANSNTLF